MSAAVTTPLLAARDLMIVSGRRTLVSGLTLTVRPGSLTWIVGENGAGKSSLLRVFARRASAAGSIEYLPEPRLRDIAFYSPLMGPPAHVTVGRWLAFHHQLPAAPAARIAQADALLPDVRAAALLTRLSTGETKRLLLWGLLRVQRSFTFLDEPYEHLSPAAKHSLTDLLRARALRGVVVVATNQEVPDHGAMHVVEVA
ncbi:MAG: ABC transporter ATP-binding protein [Gemmatimonadota bacterium]